MPKMLCVFANAFPYGTWEPFLEREVRFYGGYDGFDEIVIFSLSVRKEQAEVRRTLPEQIQVVPIRFRSRLFYALNSIRVLAIKEFWSELSFLRSKKKLNIRRFVQLVVFLSRADFESRAIRSWLESSYRDIKAYEATLYSYRFLYQPFVMARVADLFREPRLIARAHRADLYEEASATGYLPLRHYSGKVLDRLSLISKHGVEYTRNLLPEISSKTSLDYLGTEDRGIASISSKRRPLLLVTCSNVVPVKRLNLLVEALGLLDSSVPVSWTHFGDGPLLDSIKALADETLENITVNFRGAVSNQQILSEYVEGNFHVLVNTSESEGLPVSIMEACSVGMPVIATDVGGTSEIVKDSLNGYLLAEDATPRDIADSILKVANSSDSEYQSMRLESRSIWEKSFNSVDNYKAFVTDVLAGKTA